MPPPYVYTASGQVQTFTVTKAGRYDITGYGARGGSSSAASGGNGAEAGGYFDLVEGEKLRIIVGGQGGDGTFAGAGGGGSFVLASIDDGASYAPLLVAGGGGGGYAATGGYGTVSSAGPGTGGDAASYAGGGGGGAGVKSGGSSYYAYAHQGGQNGNGNYAGGVGSIGVNGGYGGGGGGGKYGGGGGGGYTGGSAGAFLVGGGGTSFDSGTAIAAQTVAGQNPGAGKVQILFVSACYVTGTLIRTVLGDVAVEALQVGDVVVTTSGAQRAIKWIGQRRTDCARHPEPRQVWPFRVRAGALGAGLPYADLWLSPGHAVGIDDVLVPVRALAHGDLVRQVGTDEITYWHVELESHDVILANGMPAESYLDTGNRSAFSNAEGSVDLYADFEPRSTADYCRPFVESGAVLSRIRARLFGTGSAGPARERGLHLVADGAVLSPFLGAGAASFVVPARARELRLVSSSRKAAAPDIRTLGILVASLEIDSGSHRRAIPLDDPGLFAGFHGIETSAAGDWRWTNGDAHLSPDLWAEIDGAFMLHLTGIFDYATNEGLPEEAKRAA